MTPINHTQDNRKGDMAEFYAVTWLWDNGYEVFKNCGCTGPVDLIATKDGKTTLIDVKTKSGRSVRKFIILITNLFTHSFCMP